MSAADFLDTNLLLYLVSDRAKAERIEALLTTGSGISIQVSNEFASVASRKLGRPMHEIREVLTDIRAICSVKTAGIETHELGLSIAERYKFSVYDSMLLAAAVKAGCTTFYTEDLQHGQVIDGLTIRNPFIP